MQRVSQHALNIIFSRDLLVVFSCRQIYVDWVIKGGDLVAIIHYLYRLTTVRCRYLQYKVPWIWLKFGILSTTTSASISNIDFPPSVERSFWRMFIVTEGIWIKPHFGLYLSVDPVSCTHAWGVIPPWVTSFFPLDLLSCGRCSELRQYASRFYGICRSLLCTRWDCR